MVIYFGSKKEYAPVAQLDRVFGYEPKGRGFESLPACQIESELCSGSIFFIYKKGEGIRTLRGLTRKRKQSGGLFSAARSERKGARAVNFAKQKAYPFRRARLSLNFVRAQSFLFIKKGKGFEP